MRKEAGESRTVSARSLELDTHRAAEAADRLTDGLLVVDANRTIVWCNSVVHDRLGRLSPARRTRALDALLDGHGEEATGLAGMLDHRLLLDLGRESLDVRMSGVSVSVEGRDLIVLHLRLAAPEPDAELGPTPALRIAALGPLSVEIDGESYAGSWQHRRPGQLLRFLIARRRRPVATEVIASELWPGRGAAGISNVRYSMYRLRGELDERAPRHPSVIATRAGGYRLDAARLQLDVDDFERRVSDARRAAVTGDHDAARVAYATAMGLYRGDFLAEELYAEWAFREREYLRDQMTHTLGWLMKDALDRADLPAAADYAHRLSELEPLDGGIHRSLVEICLRQGRHGEALRQYATYRERLGRTFGVSPDFSLPEVAAQVARDELSPDRRTDDPPRSGRAVESV
jgi:DNA-binding SARP family transcriptional activator